MVPKVSNIQVFIKYKDPSGVETRKTLTTDSIGNYQITFTPTLSGIYTAQVSWDSDLNNLESSNFVQFTVTTVQSKNSLTSIPSNPIISIIIGIALATIVFLSSRKKHLRAYTQMI